MADQSMYLSLNILFEEHSILQVFSNKAYQNHLLKNLTFLEYNSSLNRKDVVSFLFDACLPFKVLFLICMDLLHNLE